VPLSFRPCKTAHVDLAEWFQIPFLDRMLTHTHTHKHTHTRLTDLGSTWIWKNSFTCQQFLLCQYCCCFLRYAQGTWIENFWWRKL